MKKTFRFLGLMLISVMSYGLTSCGSDDDDAGISITPSSVSMHYEDTKQLSAQGATSWSSNDDFVAKVDQTGLVTGGHVGTTQITASNGKKTAICEVTITPEYNLYDTPILEWGASENSIKSKETHEFLSSSGDYLYYDYTKGKSSCFLAYNFENGKLKGILVVLDYSYYADAGYYLLERYQPVGESEGMYLFIDALTQSKATTAIGFETSTMSGSKVVSIIYLSASSNLRSVSNATNISNSIINALEEQPELLQNIK